MEAIQRTLSDGNIAEFDVGTPPEVMDRAIRHYEAVLSNQDDSLGESAGKFGKSVLRGMGEGAAQTVEMPFQAGQYLYEVGKNLWEEGHGRPYTRQPVASPASDEYNRLAGEPIPGYEGVNDWTATIAPAVVEAVGTLGAGAIPAISSALTRQGVKQAIKTGAREAGSIAVRAPARAVGTTAVGIGGAELGQNLGERMGGDIGGEIGGGLGGMFAGAVSPASKAAIKKAFFDSKSGDRLKAALRLKDMGADIPITGGLLSPKKLGGREDRLARSPLSGGARAIETRRGQYAGLDHALQLVAQRIRGRETGGPITKASIGNDIIAMLGEADVKIDKKMSTLQEALANQVGLLTDTDAMIIDSALLGVSKDRTLSAGQRDQALRMRSELRKSYENITPGANDIGPPSPTMTYGATKQNRTERGQLMKDEEVSQLVDAPAYEAMTKMMKEAADASGGPLDFDQTQHVYEQWVKQQKEIRKQLGTRTQDSADTAGFAPEAGAYNKLLGGNSKGSVRQFDPYEEHTPKALDDILADALELETRGENAGRPVDPEAFDPSAVGKNYTSRSDEWKEKVTRGDATAKRQLEDIDMLAKAEISRPGRRAVPARTGSTIGEAQVPAATIKAGMLHNIAGLPGAALGYTVGPLSRYTQSHLLTNEPNLKRLFSKEPLAVSAVRAGVGAGMGANATRPDPFAGGGVGSRVRINDPDSPDNGSGGEVVEVGKNMVRFRDEKGNIRTVGKQLLQLEDQ